jgi:hypothetical protein
MTSHWTETVTDSLSLAQAFTFLHNPMKGDSITRELATRLANRCAGGVDMFWAAVAEYVGKTETKRIRSL